MAEAELEVEEPAVAGNRTLAIALGVLVVLSLLVLGYYSRRPPDTAPVALPPQTPGSKPLETPTQAPGSIKVYVAGEVKKPGVVSLSEGSRVEDAVRKAGGMTPKGDPLAINLAARVKDEQMIVVPARGASPAPPVEITPDPVTDSEPEPEPVTTITPTSAPPPPGGNKPVQGDWSQYIAASPPSDSPPLKVSLNRGTRAELEAVPGIGPELARAIVAYRTGPPARNFLALEDLLQVPGIKEKKLDKIRPYVDL